jgi:hypothetical protein
MVHSAAVSAVVATAESLVVKEEMFALIANLFQSLYGAGWGNFANYETRSKKLLSDQLKDSPTGLCSKSFFSRAVCPNDS